MGLNLSMISGLYARWKSTPYIAQARETSKHWEADWSTMKYRSRLKALFDVNDGALDSPRSEIKWNNKGYRKLVRRLKIIVVDELGAKWDSRFMEVVYYCATRHLWMIPRYDFSHFAVISRPSENNSKENNRKMNQDAFECTSWITWSSLKYEYDIEPFSWHDRFGWKPDPKPKEWGSKDEDLELSRKRLGKMMRSMDVDVFHSESGVQLLGNPEDAGIDMCLHRAKKLQAEVEAVWKRESSEGWSADPGEP